MSAPTIADAKRTALVLAAAQAIVGAAAPIAISMGALAGSYLLGPDKSLATAPVTGFTLGVALGALPAAGLMRGVGRRIGFIGGAGITATGGGLAAQALLVGNFWFFCFALLVIGVGNAFVQQYRFAAADNAPDAFKARAISWVLGGGIFSAILGPQTVILTRDLFAPVSFAGSFAAIVAIALVGAAVLSRLRLAQDTAIGPASHASEPARPLFEIVLTPNFLVAFICGVSSYALMSFVMTGAPLAMVGCGFTPDEATLGISWHVMAMFAPSFFTGRLISRFGRETIIAAGMLLLAGCGIVALSGIALWQFWTALILLGIGWNFAFIGSTSLVATSYRPAEQGKVQGFHDLLLFGTVALASLMSGKIYVIGGWDWLNWLIFPVVALCLLLVGLLAAMARHPLKAG